MSQSPKRKRRVIIALAVLALLVASSWASASQQTPPSFQASSAEQGGAAASSLAATSPAEGTVSSESSSATSSSESNDAGIGLEVRYIDVGQGDAALISCEGHYLLIDGGPPSASRRIHALLTQNGITHLDAIVATHPDSDHIGGIPAALHAATCGTCYCSANASDASVFADMKSLLDAQGVPVTVPTVPTSFSLGSATVDIIGPLAAYAGDNDNSLVCKVTYGNTKFLFMGDAEEEAEQALVRAGVNLEADIIKIGHHGSAHSTTTPLLKAANPVYAIISVGASNDYGHPAQETLERLQAAEVEWWRTDTSGDIVASSDGDVIYVSPTKEPAVMNEQALGPAGGTVAAERSSVWYEKRHYVLNTNPDRMKIHLPDCPSVAKMSDKNRKDVEATLDELTEKGYHVCGQCQPDKQL